MLMPSRKPVIVARVPNESSKPSLNCDESQIRDRFERSLLPMINRRDTRIEDCLAKMKRMSNDDGYETLADELVTLVNAQASAYASVLPKCLEYTLKKQLLRRLFMKTWHRCYKVLVVDGAPQWRLAVAEQLLRDEGGEFYRRTIQSIADAYEVDLSTLRCSNVNVIVLLAQLHVQAGDIHRYVAKTCKLAHNDDQSDLRSVLNQARHFYQRASYLAPALGRPHNQLATLALMQGRYLDAWFHYTRAATAEKPFDASADSLLELTTHIRKIAIGYDLEVNKLRDAVALLQGADSNGCMIMTESARRRQNSCDDAQRRMEVWVHPNDNSDVDDALNIALLDAPLSTLQIRAFVYALHVCGILYTKAGFDQIEYFTERVLITLRAVVEATQSPVSGRQLEQLVICAIYCAERAIQQNDESLAKSAQQQHAVRFVLSLSALLLSTVDNCLMSDDLTKAQIALPALTQICDWLSNPRVLHVLTQVCAKSLHSSHTNAPIWMLLASVGTRLANSEHKCMSDEFRRILKCALFVSQESNFVDFDNGTNTFFAAFNNVNEFEYENTSTLTRTSLLHQIDAEREAAAERRLAQIMTRSERQRKLIVLPRILVPDTNVWIDHSDDIESLCCVGDVEVLVPIVVLTELRGISRGAGSSDNEDGVSTKAQAALRLIEEHMLHSSIGNVAAVTQSGVRVRLFEVIEQYNDRTLSDDRILETVVRVIDKRDSCKERIEGSVLIVERDVVLLTRDRLLQLKASTHKCNVPVAEMHLFMQWLISSNTK